jgi:hypothetical protein
VKAVAYFFGIFGASFLVGSLMGCITALLTKFTLIRYRDLSAGSESCRAQDFCGIGFLGWFCPIKVCYRRFSVLGKLI